MMALLQTIRERYAERQERIARERRQERLRALAERKKQAVSIDRGKLILIERNINHFSRYNFSDNVPDTEVWEYFTFEFVQHDQRVLGWMVNGFSLFRNDQEEILSLSGLLEHACDGELVTGYFDHKNNLIALEKRGPEPTTLLKAAG